MQGKVIQSLTFKLFKILKLGNARLVFSHEVIKIVYPPDYLSFGSFPGVKTVINEPIRLLHVITEIVSLILDSSVTCHWKPSGSL